MEDRVVKASTFKEKCLALLDLVAQSKQSIVVTKRGKPVARVVPLEQPTTRKPLAGSVTYLVDEGELFSTGEVWEADEPVG